MQNNYLINLQKFVYPGFYFPVSLSDFGLLVLQHYAHIFPPVQNLLTPAIHISFPDISYSYSIIQ